MSIHCGAVTENSAYKTHSPHLQPLMYSFPMLAHGSPASELHFLASPECHSWADFCHDLTQWTSLDWPCCSFPPQNTYLSTMTILFQAWPLSEFAGRMDFTGTMTQSRLWVPNLKLSLSFSQFMLQWALAKMWPPSSRIKSPGVSELSSCSYKRRCWWVKCKRIRVWRI